MRLLLPKLKTTTTKFPKENPNGILNTPHSYFVRNITADTKRPACLQWPPMDYEWMRIGVATSGRCPIVDATSHCRFNEYSQIHCIYSGPIPAMIAPWTWLDLSHFASRAPTCTCWPFICWTAANYSEFHDVFHLLAYWVQKLLCVLP